MKKATMVGLALFSMITSAFAAGKPNIMFIFADDQTFETIGAYKEEQRHPRLDVQGGETVAELLVLVGITQGAVDFPIIREMVTQLPVDGPGGGLLVKAAVRIRQPFEDQEIVREDKGAEFVQLVLGIEGAGQPFQGAAIVIRYQAKFLGPGFDGALTWTSR